MDEPSSMKRPARILCYINTYSGNYDKKAIHVQNTWARRCDKLWFTSIRKHERLKVLQLNISVSEVKKHLWVKMRAILRRLYEEADHSEYFFKTDDDTYAIMENLRVELNRHSHNDPFMTGYRWQLRIPYGYFSGGAGYVLSRAALKQIVEKAIDRHPDCPTADENMEDVKMSKYEKI
ncbi:Glycoprotein-N-acetylgalactosamine 3-beta-galactosyltransferase 1 [Paragonimus heterotremus]|uniref:N-acetylgalactosaminide beta-1,3-galactosyltransferase n=1 Tax=Paragonimus heterotremus TaxID=100268 RepID=A0A8J4WL82_9TREM|nr:Glycoprotein-N-acetylgalactosamine 3-beta-galactosyltransferase 1 [Paragonimus heterotremus]